MAALLLIAGSTYAWLVPLVWAARPAAERLQFRPERIAKLRYGLLLGTGAALAYLIASASHLDHPGWAPADCLLVARPATGLLKTRATGRILAVAVVCSGRWRS